MNAQAKVIGPSSLSSPTRQPSPHDLLRLTLAGLFAGVIGASVFYFIFSEVPAFPEPILYTGSAVCFAAAATAVVGRADKKKTPRPGITARMGGMTWTRNEFCTGWYILGVTGFGKSQFLDYLLHQLFRHEKTFGGVFIDEKGLYDTVLVPMAKHYGRERDLKVFETRPLGADSSWRPKQKYNVFSDERVPENTYAEVIANVAAASMGGKSSDEKGFFRTQAIAHIGKGIALMREIRACQQKAGLPREQWVMPAPNIICDILNSKVDWDAFLTKVKILVEEEEIGADGKGTGKMEKCFSYDLLDSPALRSLLSHFRDKFWGVEGKDQLAGVQGTIFNYLSFFTHPEISDVFCCQENTIEFDAIDEGGLFLIVMPQKFLIERRVISALFKQIWYTHVLRRYDLKRLNPRLVLNLSVLFQDEGQRFISKVDQNVEIIRAAEATTVICTQSQASVAQALGGKDQASPTTLNLRNRFIMRATDEWCAEESAKFLGKHAVKRVNKSVTNGRPTRQYSYESRYWIEPHSFRKFPKFHGVLVHNSGRWKPVCFRPLTADGKVPAWFRQFEPFTMKLARWVGLELESVSVAVPDQIPDRA